MKKLLLLFIVVILLVGTVSAVEWDNVRSYDKETKTITIKNAFDLPLIGYDIATIKLNTPHNYYVGAGYGKVAEFELNTFVDYEIAFKELEFYYKIGMEKFERDYDYKYKTTEQVPNYELECDEKEHINGTKYNDCNERQVGFKDKVVWKDLTSVNFRKDDKITIGIFTEVEVGDKVEWIPNFFGERITEWAVWTAALNVGLQSYYKFDEASTGGALEVNDSVGHQNATNIGPALNISGIINSAYNFSNDSITLADNASLENTDTISAQAWINPQSLPSFPTFTMIIAKGDLTTGFALTWRALDDVLFLCIDNQCAGVLFNTLNSWSHIVGTYDKVTVSLYIDGVSVANASDTSGLTQNANNITIGSDPLGNNQFFDGGIDEVGFWNRTLTVGEVQNLYNGGTGISFTDVFGPTIVLNAPDDNSNFTESNVTFNITVTNNVQNVTLFIDGVLNETNSSGVSGDYIFEKIIADGGHNWSIGGTDISDGTSNSSIRTFTIDTIEPALNLTAPTGTLDFGILTINETLSWTVTDTNLDTCFYDYNFTNTTVTCGDNTTTFTLTSQRNLTFYANDTVGHLVSNFTTWNYKIFENNQTFTAQVTEGSAETFSINYNVDPSSTVTIANLSYNNTGNIGSITNIDGGNFVATRTLSIPIVTIDTNVTFFWNFTFSDASTINASVNTQTIKDLNISNCSINKNLLFNLTLSDEEIQNVLSGAGDKTLIEVDIDLSAFGTITPIIEFFQAYNQTNPAEICLNLPLPTTTMYRLDSTFKYQAENYSVEHYNIQNFTLENTTAGQEITLFDLLSEDATEFRITFKDDNFVVVENALIQINRQYVAEGTFKTVEIPKTDSNGQTVAHLVEKDVVYNIIVIKEGEILGTFNNVVAFCDDVVTGACFINLNALKTNPPILDIDTELGLASSFDYNLTTRVLSYTFTVLDGSVKNVTLNAVKMDQLGNDTVCFESLVSASGVITCTVPASVGNETIITTILVDGDPTITTFISAGRDFDIGDAGFFILFFLVLTFALMFIESKSGVIIGVILGFITSALFGLTQGTVIGVGSAIIWLIIAGGILVWKLNKEAQT